MSGKPKPQKGPFPDPAFATLFRRAEYPVPSLGKLKEFFDKRLLFLLILRHTFESKRA